MKKAIIVASGPSLNDIHPNDIVETSLHSKADIIAVNGAADWLPKFNIFFTLDPSKKNIERMNRNLPQVQYFCAYDFDKFYKIPNHVTKLIRVIGSGIVPPSAHKKDSPEWWLHKWKCKLGLSERAGYIHTGNSAYGALGLAYLSGYTHILFLGLDANEEPRVNNEGLTEYSIKHLPLLFRSAKPQLLSKNISIINGSLNSMVTCFARTTQCKGLDWIENVK